MKNSTIDIIKGIRDGSLDDLNYMKQLTTNDITQLKQNIASAEQDNILLGNQIKDLGEAKKLLIRLKNSKMTDKKDFILTTINTALSDVFMDQDIKIDLIASNTNSDASKLNIKYDIVLFQNGLEMARNEKLLVKNGGGVLSFISILFKILVGFIYSKNKFYIFDESLAEVSEVYRPRMAQFIQKFCSVHQFNIIIITQTSDIAEFADIVYHLDGDFQDGIPTLKIEKIDGEYPEENYIYTKIENFQSIKKLEFRYRGFTAVIGKNNIGKSASFRAVNSIIFNNFDMKEFPRMLSAEKPDKLLASKIEFGKYTVKDDPENEKTKILMYKKGASLIYEFNGDTFVGKNLAFDKVKEKVEEIGFKYLNLKEQYKNFKGNLKDQTERLAITTQQDGYYLIGSKTNDTSKVFDFLFDSREVTIAISDLNNDVLNKEQNLNTNINNINVFRNRIKLYEIKVNLIRSIYKTKLIQAIYSISSDIHHLENELFILGKLKKNYDTSIDISTKLYAINQANYYLDEIIKTEDGLVKRLDIYNGLEGNLNKQHVCSGILKTQYDLKYYWYKASLLQNKINKGFIELFMFTKNHIEFIKKRELSLHRIFNNLTKLLNNYQNIGFIENYIIQYERVKNTNFRLEFLHKKINTLDSLIDVVNKRINLDNVLYNKNSQIRYIEDLIKAQHYKNYQIKYFTSLIKSWEIKNLIDNISLNKKEVNDNYLKINNLLTKIKNLPTDYGLHECTSCKGYGFHTH